MKSSALVRTMEIRPIFRTNDDHHYRLRRLAGDLNHLMAHKTYSLYPQLTPLLNIQLAKVVQMIADHTTYLDQEWLEQVMNRMICHPTNLPFLVILMKIA